MKLPKWARKPKHKEKVVVSEHGWIVERTGEILVSIRNLDKKMVEFLGQEESPETKKEETKVEKTIPEPEKTDNTSEEKKSSPPKKKRAPRKKAVAKKKKATVKRKTPSKKKKVEDAESDEG